MPKLALIEIGGWLLKKLRPRNNKRSLSATSIDRPVSMGQQHGKFFATEPPDQVALPQLPGRGLGHGSQHRGASMTVGV